MSEGVDSLRLARCRSGWKINSQEQGGQIITIFILEREALEEVTKQRLCMQVVHVLGSTQQGTRTHRE